MERLRCAKECRARGNIRFKEQRWNDCVPLYRTALMHLQNIQVLQDQKVCSVPTRQSDHCSFFPCRILESPVTPPPLLPAVIKPRCRRAPSAAVHLHEPLSRVTLPHLSELCS